VLRCPGAMKSAASSSLNLHVYRYGESNRQPGLSLGVTRHLPRGVRRENYAKDGYFDVWLPLLAPSRELVGAYQKGRISHAVFARCYRAEMREPAARQTIRLVAAMARVHRVNLGCFCADPARCHRTLLRDLVAAEAAGLPPPAPERRTFASPACTMPEIED